MIKNEYKRELNNCKKKSALMNDFIERGPSRIKKFQKWESSRCRRNTTEIYKTI